MAGFGKRGLNKDQYVIPPREWADPKAASFFERIGATPNDDDNIRVTPEAVERMIANALEEAQSTREFGRFADFCDDMIRQVKALARMFRTYIAKAHKASAGRPWFEGFDRFFMEHPEIRQSGAKA